MTTLREAELRTRFKVYATQGQGSCLVKTFSFLKAAKAYVKNHACEASFAIQYPDGRWYDWSDNVASKARKPKRRS